MSNESFVRKMQPSLKDVFLHVWNQNFVNKVLVKLQNLSKSAIMYGL